MISEMVQAMRDPNVAGSTDPLFTDLAKVLEGLQESADTARDKQREQHAQAELLKAQISSVVSRLCAGAGVTAHTLYPKWNQAEASLGERTVFLLIYGGKAVCLRVLCLFESDSGSVCRLESSVVGHSVEPDQRDCISLKGATSAIVHIVAQLVAD